MDRYRSRREWGAAPPRGTLDLGKRLRHMVFIHHTATPAWVGDEAARKVQQIAFGRGFADVSYTKLVDVNGIRYQGRDSRFIGAHTLGYNDTAHAIVAIGNFEEQEPTEELVRGIATQIISMRNGGTLTFNCSIRPHNAVSSTACPGKLLIARLPDIRKMVKEGTQNG